MNIGVVVGLVIQALPFNLYEQYIGKLIQGTCAGTFCVITPVFINEIPIENRLMVPHIEIFSLGTYKKNRFSMEFLLINDFFVRFALRPA